MARAKRYFPHNPALAEYQRQQREAAEAAKRDRRSTDLLRNAMVAPIEVNDPSPAAEPGDRIVVMRSIRNDPLAKMHTHRQIDEAQYYAGRAFQHDFETAERGPQAIDPSKEYVDGGLIPEPITESMRKAVVRLNQVYKELGPDGSAIIHDVLIHGSTMGAMVIRRGLDGKYWKEVFGKKFRACLDKLAKFYGLANNSDDRRRTGAQNVN